MNSMPKPLTEEPRTQRMTDLSAAGLGKSFRKIVILNDLTLQDRRFLEQNLNHHFLAEAIGAVQ